MNAAELGTEQMRPRRKLNSTESEKINRRWRGKLPLITVLSKLKPPVSQYSQNRILSTWTSLPIFLSRHWAKWNYAFASCINIWSFYVTVLLLISLFWIDQRSRRNAEGSGLLGGRGKEYDFSFLKKWNFLVWNTTIFKSCEVASFWYSHTCISGVVFK